MKFITDKNPEKVKELAIEKINTFLKDNFGKKILFLSSGGSSLDLIDGINPENFSANLTFTLIDERFTCNPTENNYQKLISKKDFMQKVDTSNAKVLNTLIYENETPEEFSLRYEEIIREYFTNNPDSLVFITFGVGQDAHTIGVKPNEEKKFNELFVDTNRNFIDYEVDDPNFSNRITATFKFVKDKMTEGIVYQVNKDFKEIWHQIEKGNFKLNEKPAGIFHDLENVEVFTDEY